MARDDLLRRALARRLAGAQMELDAGGGGGEQASDDPRAALVQSLLGSLMGVYQSHQQRAIEEAAAHRQMEIARMQMDAGRAEREQALTIAREREAGENSRFGQTLKAQTEAKQATAAEDRMQTAAARQGLRGAYETELKDLNAKLASEDTDLRHVPGFLQRSGAVIDEARANGIDLAGLEQPLLEAAVKRAAGKLGGEWQGSPHSAILALVNERKKKMGHAPVEFLGYTGSDFGWNTYPYLAAPGTPEWERAQRYRR